ncbi:hypothetical protein SLA2020_370190 [Shorea laevis]
MSVGNFNEQLVGTNKNKRKQRTQLSSHRFKTDGSALGNPGKDGAGGLICDSFGNWVIGYSQKVSKSTSLMAELWAIRDGLEIATNRGIMNLILETDSKAAKILIDAANSNWHLYGSLIDDCRFLMGRFR